MAEVNRLREPVLSGISDWLNIGWHTYDFDKFSKLLDRIADKVSLAMDEKQIKTTVREQISEWRNKQEANDALFVDFRSWTELSDSVREELEDELEEEIVDQVTAVQQRIHRDEARRHAS